MQIGVDAPNHYLDAMHQTPEDFAQEAKLAMAAKLFVRDEAFIFGHGSPTDRHGSHDLLGAVAALWCADH